MFSEYEINKLHPDDATISQQRRRQIYNVLTLTGLEGHICQSLVKGLEGHICPSVVTSWWRHCDVI